jgi:hypothetical protein
LYAVVLALVAGLWLFHKASRDTESPTAVATSPAVVTTSCRGFAADAFKLFDKGDTATLSGTFAPGDRVHLEIDFRGVGYAWELTGVLAKAEAVHANGSLWYAKVATYSLESASGSSATTMRVANPAVREEIWNTEPNATGKVVHGNFSGFARLEVDIDVTTAGEGLITVDKASSVQLFTPPTVVSASCIASKKVSPSKREEASGSGQARRVSVR